MNAKIIEGLKAVREGIDLILKGVSETDSVIEGGVKKEVKEVAVYSPATEESASTDLTREQLDGMTYNNIKKLAKERGVSAIGNREEITARLLGESADESIEEAPVEEAPTKKSVKKKIEPEEVEEVDDEEEDPVYAQVVEAVADMSNEEIADVLADIGVSAKGKREALIEKVAQAVRDGLLDFDDDEEEEEVEETPAPKKKAKKETPAPAPVEEDEDEEEDLTNDLDNPDMTEARKKAILAQDSSIRKQFKKGDVTRDNLVEFLQSFYDTDEDMDDMSDEDVLDTYIDAVCRLIDDDGDLIEEGAYTLNGEPACCGHVLAYSEDTNMFICEHCGEEYEAE